MTEELTKYAIEIARPKMCEIQLSRFLIKCKNCVTKEEIFKIFLEFITIKER